MDTQIGVPAERSSQYLIESVSAGPICNGRLSPPPADGKQFRKAQAIAQPAPQPDNEASGWRWSWDALAYREFRLYFIGSVFSNLGTWLQNTAQALLAYQMTHSVLGIGAVVCAQF